MAEETDQARFLRKPWRRTRQKRNCHDKGKGKGTGWTTISAKRWGLIAQHKRVGVVGAPAGHLIVPRGSREPNG
jgi:hypothetical protein